MIMFEVQANLSEESGFNFIKIYLIIHFSHHIYQLGHVSNISFKLSEHTIIDIKAAYHISNRNEVAEYILHMNTQRNFFAFQNLNHHLQIL